MTPTISVRQGMIDQVMADDDYNNDDDDNDDNEGATPHRGLRGGPHSPAARPRDWILHHALRL